MRKVFFRGGLCSHVGGAMLAPTGLGSSSLPHEATRTVVCLGHSDGWQGQGGGGITCRAGPPPLPTSLGGTSHRNGACGVWLPYAPFWPSE